MKRRPAVPRPTFSLVGLEKPKRAIQVEMEEGSTNAIQESDVLEGLRSFDPVWTALTTAEQTRIVKAVVERINYDGSTGRISLVWREAALPLLTRSEKQ